MKNTDQILTEIQNRLDEINKEIEQYDENQNVIDELNSASAELISLSNWIKE